MHHWSHSEFAIAPLDVFVILKCKQVFGSEAVESVYALL